jgi:tRNA (guanine37-N1)-methyltransferase
MPLRVSIVTLFPEYFSGPVGCGPTRVAQSGGVLAVDFVNPRDFTSDVHRTVDDYPFGGGAGMVMKPEPLAAAIESVRTAASRVVLLSPRGRRFGQAVAQHYAQQPHVVLVCGRYKAVDERTAQLCDDELSVGDFVLAGGEAAAVAVVEAMARLLPGAVGDSDSVATDSFSTGLLDSPYYTRPAEFRGQAVPDVLLSGDHAEVARWRREQALIATAQRRPDLLRDEILTDSERDCLCRSLHAQLKIEKEFAHGKAS